MEKKFKLNKVHKDLITDTRRERTLSDILQTYSSKQTWNSAASDKYNNRTDITVWKMIRTTSTDSIA